MLFQEYQVISTAYVMSAKSRVELMVEVSQLIEEGYDSLEIR